MTTDNTKTIEENLNKPDDLLIKCAIAEQEIDIGNFNLTLGSRKLWANNLCDFIHCLLETYEVENIVEVLFNHFIRENPDASDGSEYT